MDKVFPSIEEAIADIPDGATIGFTGFFTCGNPIYLTRALAKQGAKNLTIVVMQLGVGNEEINDLLKNGQVKKAVCNYPFYRSFSRKSLFEELLRTGKIECELYPMGTFAEKLRAAGAGIPAFYTPTGVGTYVAEGKEVKVLDGKECLLEKALPSGLRLCPCLEGRPHGKCRLPQDSQELQSGCSQGCQDYYCRGRKCGRNR